MRSQIVALAVLMAPGSGWAQSPIDTNRPGFTSSPAVVSPGQWQLETGLDYVHGKGSNRSWSVPVAEIRTGAADGVELFANGITWTRQEMKSDTNKGFKDIGAGVKIRLTGEDSVLSTALLGQLSVPVGEKEFTSDRWDPTAAFVWASNGDVAISGTVKVSKFKSGYQLDNGLKWALQAGDMGTAFIEWEANIPEQGDDTHWMNIGYQLLGSQVMQFDLNAGVGLNNATDDYRLGVGFSYRF